MSLNRAIQTQRLIQAAMVTSQGYPDSGSFPDDTDWHPSEQGSARQGRQGRLGNPDYVSTRQGRLGDPGDVLISTRVVRQGRIPNEESGFTHQGRPAGSLYQVQMEVSAETHGDYWEDDMDYHEEVDYSSLVATSSDAVNETPKTIPVPTSMAQSTTKNCDGCPPVGKVLPMVRRCSRWSAITIAYQTRICGTFYNPATKQIQEFKYFGVSFDGWKPELCQFWEAKARYDQFLISDTVAKRWWRGVYSARNQGLRHQAVATANKPVKIVWICMQPISARFFQFLFVGMPDITVIYRP